MIVVGSCDLELNFSPGVLVCTWVEEDPIIGEADNGGHCATLSCRGRTNYGDGAKLPIQEERWLRHDQVGLEVVSWVGTSAAWIRVDSAIQVRKRKITVGDIGSIAGLVVPRLEVHYLGSADTQQNPQDL